MAIIKSNRDYTIRLRLDFGDYYLSRVDSNTYYFTQKLSSVKKWKTLKGASDSIKNMTNIYSKIVIPLGVDISKYSVEIQKFSYCVANKYYFKISKLNTIRVNNKYLDNEQEKLVDEMNKIGISINDAINSKLINVDFLKIQSLELVQKAKEYDDIVKQKAKNQVNSNFELNLVDVSFNFRTLKMKNLAEINKEELEEK